MMMAIYVADPSVPILQEELSSAELYRRLLAHFAEREAAKNLSASPDPADVRDLVEAMLNRLSTAALGMFNRGRQDITVDDLGADLAALEARGAVTVSERTNLGHHVLGEFFFVYAAEANFLATELPSRRYEFLHATFGEYLVIRRILDELAEVADAAFTRRGMREPDDSLLFALMSFEVLAVRRPTLGFAAEMAKQLPVQDRTRMIALLDALIARYRTRHPSGRFKDYRPRPADQVRELAAYSANLVMLRLVLSEEASTPLNALCLHEEDPHQVWRSILNLWQAGLSAEGSQEMLSCLTLDNDRLTVGLKGSQAGTSEFLHARLAGEVRTANAIRFGIAFQENIHWINSGEGFTDVMEPWISAALADAQAGITTIFDEDGAEVIPEATLYRLEMLLKVSPKIMNIDQLKSVVKFLLAQLPGRVIDPSALASVVINRPELLRLVPELRDPGLYATSSACLLLRSIVDLGSIRGRPPLPQILIDLADDVSERIGFGVQDPEVARSVLRLVESYMWRNAEVPRLGWHDVERDPHKDRSALK